MDKYLYFRTNRFNSNKELAEWFQSELNKNNVATGELIDEDYMFVIEAKFDDASVNFYLGRNDEDASPPIWQIWPEQKVGFVKKILGKANMGPEESARKLLSNIINNATDVSDIEWDSV